MLTIFTCPKPFDDAHIRMIQRNALIGWRHLRPAPEIILVGDDAGTAETAAELELRHIPEVARNEYGTPLLPSVFGEAERAAAFPVMAYVNCDILLFQDFMDTVSAVCRRCFPDASGTRAVQSDGDRFFLRQKRRFLMVGERTDVDVDASLALSETGLDAGRYAAWEGNVRAALAERGRPYGPIGIDYYVYPKGLWPPIPDFALGRCAWDNWLVWAARASGADVLDATEAVAIVHQNHGYRHAVDRNRNGVWNGEEANANRALARGGYMDILDCTHYIEGAGRIRRVNDPDRIHRRMVVMSKLHPRLWRLLRSWRIRRLTALGFPGLARPDLSSPKSLI